MEVLDWSLGITEALVAPGSLAFLLLARSRTARIASVVLAAAIGVTLVHPFGVDVAEVPEVPAGAVERDADELHAMRIAGVPAVPFKLYRRDKLGVFVDEETEARATLRTRSWIWPFLFTSGTEVTPLCDNSFRTPCWDPRYDERDTAGPSGSPYHDTLSIWSKEGDSWVAVANPDPAADPAAPRDSYSSFVPP